MFMLICFRGRFLDNSFDLVMISIAMILNLGECSSRMSFPFVAFVVTDCSTCTCISVRTIVCIWLCIMMMC